jgi:hypothetical protein
LITPDSNALALLQGQGVAILPLKPGAKPLDFIPKFGQVLSFARDGSAAAMVQFNADPAQPTRSLFLVTNQAFRKNCYAQQVQFLAVSLLRIRILSTVYLPN